MPSLFPSNPVFRPGRYVAIDVGSHSTLLLVADLDSAGRLTPLMEVEEPTRLSEQFYTTNRLLRAARRRTLSAIAECIDAAREEGATSISVVGTSVLREASNAPDFLQEVQLGCGIPLIVLSGVREAELAYLGNLFNRSLSSTEGERVLTGSRRSGRRESSSEAGDAAEPRPNRAPRRHRAGGRGPRHLLVC